MAYSDYGAFVYKDGKRRGDKEDVPVFGADEELEVGAGARVCVNILKNRDSGNGEWWSYFQHGVMGDGDVRVSCYKQGFPSVWYIDDGGEVKELSTDEIIELCGPECMGYVEEYDGNRCFGYTYDVDFEFKGCRMRFRSDEFGRTPKYSAEMVDSDGSEWECSYDYWYGAGF